MTNYLTNLNDSQREAVTLVGRPVRVVAGAGTGKTRVLTHRIAHLIADNHAQPDSILALTFTNKAAEEMQDRVDELVTADTLPPTSTFHSFGARFLRRHADKLSVSENFIIKDSQQSQKLVRQAIADTGQDPDQWDAGTIAGFINKRKSEGQTADEFARRADQAGRFEPTVAEVWPAYRDMLREQDSVDFADLLLLTERLLSKQETIRQRYQNRFAHVLVDEYQDTNPLQSDIVKLLVGDNPQVFVVGDGDQTIYSWRGATPDNIFSFEEEFPNAETIVLSENYRSTETILQAANDVIAENDKRHDKQLKTNNPTGDKITLHTAQSAEDEARRIAETVGRNQPGEWAVLYRTNAQSRVVEEALMDAGIDYQIAGTSFFDRKEVRDLLAYLRLALNRDADADRRRIISRPRRGIGEKTIDKFLSGRTADIAASRQKKLDKFEQLLDKIADTIRTTAPSRAVREIISISGLDDFYAEQTQRLENMQELSGMAAEYDDEFSQDPSAMRAFLRNVALASDQDQLGDEGVQLMTVHAAKGLEFPRVWIAGLEDGLFPHQRDTEVVDEEERRLFYVALTRAQEKLVLSYAQSRRLYGEIQWNNPSPFLDHIYEELITPADQQRPSGGEDEVVFFD